MARDKNCGIYKITNKINGKSYIGLSGDVFIRWSEHRCHYKTIDNILYRAMRKYGIENFTFEILENCSKYELGEREKFYIRKYRTYVGFEDCNGYNMTLGGEESEGMIFTEEIKKKMSEKRQLGNNPAARKVYVGNKIFGTIKEAAEYLKVSAKNLSRWLNRTRGLPKEKEYLLQYKIGFVGQPPLTQDFFGRGEPVKCDGIVFNSVKECAEYLNISNSKLISYLKGRTCVSEQLKNRGLRYVNKETLFKNKEKSWYQSISFLHDGKEFKNISELREYLDCPISSIYNHLHNKNNGNTFIYKGKEITWKEVG